MGDNFCTKCDILIETFAAEHIPTNPGSDSDAECWQIICAETDKSESVDETGRSYKIWFNLLYPVRNFMIKSLMRNTLLTQ